MGIFSLFSWLRTAGAWYRRVGITAAHHSKLQPALLQPPQYFYSKHTDCQQLCIVEVVSESECLTKEL